MTNHIFQIFCQLSKLIFEDICAIVKNNLVYKIHESLHIIIKILHTFRRVFFLELNLYVHISSFNEKNYLLDNGWRYWPKRCAEFVLKNCWINCSIQDLVYFRSKIILNENLIYIIKLPLWSLRKIWKLS